MKNQEEIARLILKFLQRAISPSEKQLLNEWINASEEHRERFRAFVEPKELKQRVALWSKAGEDIEHAWEILQRQLERPELTPERRIPIYRRYWQTTAAVVLVIAGATIYFTLLYPSGHKHTSPVISTIKTDVQPGGNKALLTLADGTLITLDSVSKGIIAKQGNVEVIKKQGLVSYKGVAGKGQEAQYNLLTVPEGGQYQLLLSDGTKAWLNSASSIRYPTIFTTDKSRQVEISGEVYFEVATQLNHQKSSKVPFIVSTSKGIEIEVLGTQFNVNAYDDEPEMATTLLDGKVRINQITGLGKRSITLEPGKQALVTNNTALKIVKDVNVDQVMAWKNGLFYFNNTDFATIMRQLSRWYSVVIVYEGKVPQFKLNGEASRNMSLSNLLSMLQLTDVKCRIEGKKLIIPEQ